MTDKEIIVTSAFDVPGRQISRILGIARGNTIRVRNVGRDIAAGLRSIVGGEVKTFTDLATQARDEAFNRMINDAIKMSADAIIGFNFSTSTVMHNSSEMLAYGTAVKLK
jgi:uncharacterized protein YbjQ (UPF0145 family)